MDATRPNRKEPCYDCGSTIPGHHTPLCEFALEGDARDLPQIPGTQWWTACREDGKFDGLRVPPGERPTTL